MVFPLFKVLVVVLKTTSKPFANFLKIMLKNRLMMQHMFVWAGNKANEFEAKINYRAAHPNSKTSMEKVEIPEIT